MVPLPNFLYWPLSLKFQLLSSEIGVSMLSLLGIPVLLEGNIIDLGSYQLQVAEACSGLGYLFPLMSFGFLFAVLYKGPVWHKFVLFAATIPLTILMNAVRIAVTGILVDRYGIEQAEGFLHFFEGWVVFLLCVLMLYGIAALLQRLVPSPRPIYTMLDFDLAALRRELSRIRFVPSSPALVLASVCILMAGLFWHLMPARAVADLEREALARFPLELGTWQGTKQTLDPETAKALGADDHLLANYRSEDLPVNLLVVYFASQEQGRSIHSPAVCIPGGGWEVSGWRKIDTGLHTSSNQSLQVNRAVIQKGNERQLVYYWFDQRGRALTNDYLTKAYTALDAIRRGRTDGALVRLITPIKGTGDQEADLRLTAFMQKFLPVIPRYVPN
jgi:exosortase D (VPLPA-CTERM-specific)